MTTGTNPWQAESLQDFSFLCCPECVFRTQEEIDFQSHALITHPESRNFFNKLEGMDVYNVYTSKYFTVLRLV